MGIAATIWMRVHYMVPAMTTVYTCRHCYRNNIAHGWRLNPETGLPEVCTFCNGKPQWTLDKKRNRKPV